VVRTLAYLSAWAKRAGHIDTPNPVAGVERPRTTHSIDFLTKPEIATLLSATGRAARVGVASWQALVLRPMVTTAIYAGLRKGELFALRWRDLDLDARRLTVARSYELLPKSGLVRS
jgi:integrase